ncbi:AMP-dependent synthetase/ligase [Nocardioides mangrovi]|uniref:AMP-dependent synthetase/ligase n=1 Tax=Nocardioides mangrovi TaxID=2874580 RepID=A0ABS7UBM7_9ACTN|nr:AMP-dependent synthetase/ligase [Nocardioides mangrovi]MBZ5738413.1 AMP-dependent synthetase/ligase [Nocardioides mangrovi]
MTDDFPTLCASFQAVAAEGGDRLALAAPGHPGITWREYAEQVAGLAVGFAALGVRRGERVALLMGPRPEFSVADTALLHAGATPYSLQESEPVDRLVALLGVAGSRVLVTDARLLPLARDAAARMPLTLVSVDGPADGVLGLDDVRAAADPDADAAALWRAVTPDDIATLIFTSGTTGVPKAVQLSHRAISSSAADTFALAPVTRFGEVLSYLPLNHIAERFMSHYAGLTAGLTVHSVPDPATLYDEIVRVRPTRFFGVPRIYEKLVDRIRALLDADPSLDADGLRAAVGLDRAEYLGVATAPAAYEMLAYLHAVGFPVSDIWGMSEAVMCTLNPPGDIRLGTVGRFLPGMEGRIAEDGEVQVRGRHVFSGYVGDPDRTAEILGADGWVRTGDLGRIDDDYLTILGRKKELLITATGKNLMPAVIEGAVKSASPLIDHVVAIADGRRYVTALVALDEDQLRSFAAGRGLTGDFAELAASPEVRAEVDAAVRAGNERLAKPETVRGFAIADAPWPPGGDEVTTTAKLRRAEITTKYATTIERLYA